jgi:hypothetical protein
LMTHIKPTQTLLLFQLIPLHHRVHSLEEQQSRLRVSLRKPCIATLAVDPPPLVVSAFPVSSSAAGNAP